MPPPDFLAGGNHHAAATIQSVRALLEGTRSRILAQCFIYFQLVCTLVLGDKGCSGAARHGIGLVELVQLGNDPGHSRSHASTQRAAQCVMASMSGPRPVRRAPSSLESLQSRSSRTREAEPPFRRQNSSPSKVKCCNHARATPPDTHISHSTHEHKQGAAALIRSRPTNSTTTVPELEPAGRVRGWTAVLPGARACPAP